MMTLDKKMDALIETVGVLASKINKIDEKVNTIDEKFEKRFDDLESAVRGGFDDVYERFDLIDKRFDDVYTRFDHIDRRFDAIENIYVGSHERRIEVLEDKVGVINTKLGLKRNI